MICRLSLAPWLSQISCLSPLHFSSVLLTRASLKESQNLWRQNSHVLQSFHYTVAVFGSHFFHQFSVSKSGNRHKLSSPVQPRCCGETNQSLPTTRAKEGQMPHSIVQVLRQCRTCRFEFLMVAFFSMFSRGM